MKPEAVYASYAEEVDVHTNTQIQTIEQDEMTYRVTGVDGEGTVDVFRLFPGVILQFHNFHCKSFQLGNAPGRNDTSSLMTIGQVEIAKQVMEVMTMGKIFLPF